MYTTSQKWLVFVGLALSIMMVDVDMTAANLAVSAISDDLHFSLSNGQWIIDGYAMTAAVLMAFAGRCGDLFGHKKIFLGALFFFVFASLAVGFSEGFWSMTLSRTLQGACIAFTFPIAMVLVRKVFPEKEHGFAISLLISIAGICQSLGPSFGGIMIEYANWRWIFFINVPLALLCYFLISRYVKKDTTSKRANLDLIPLILLIIGLFTLMKACNEINRFGLKSFELWSLLIISIISLTLFVLKELRGNNPLIELRLFMRSSFARLITVRFIVNFIYFGWLFGLSILLQNALGYSSLIAGFILLGLTLVTAILAVPVGKWIDHVGFKPPLVIGLFIMTIANSCLAIPLAQHALWFLIVSLVIGGTSISMLIPSTATGGMMQVDMQKTGAAMGVLFTCGFLGNALGVAIIGSILAEFTIQVGIKYSMILSAFMSTFAFLLCVSVNNIKSATKE